MIDPRIQKTGNTVEELVNHNGGDDEVTRLTKPILEQVHGEGGRFLRPSFLIPPRVSREIFAAVGRREDIMPRLMSAPNAEGTGGRVRDSEEVIKGIHFTLLKGFGRGVGGGLWRRDGKLDGHMSAGDDTRRSCARDDNGRNKVPGAGDSPGGGRGLRDSGGDDSDRRHFSGLKGWEDREDCVCLEWL